MLNVLLVFKINESVYQLKLLLAGTAMHGDDMQYIQTPIPKSIINDTPFLQQNQQKKTNVTEEKIETFSLLKTSSSPSQHRFETKFLLYEICYG